MNFLSGLTRQVKRVGKNFFRHDSNSRKKKSAKSQAIETRTVIVQDGVAVIAAAGLLVFSAAARGVNLLLALGAFFIGFLFVDYFWGAATLKKLSVKRRLPDSIYAGEPFYVEIELDASLRHAPSWAIVAEDEWAPEDRRFCPPEGLEDAVGEDGQKHPAGKKGKNKKTRGASKRKSDNRRRGDLRETAEDSENESLKSLEEGAVTIRPVVYFPSIKGAEKLREYYAGVTPRRGRRRLEALTLSTRFPCGFFRSSKRILEPEEILVFPKRGRLTSKWRAYAGNLSQESVVATGMIARAPDETVSIRDWRTGDSSRTIAWRATAKRNRLQTREFAKRQTRSIVLILDLFTPTNGDERDGEKDPKLWICIEKAVSFAATLVEEWSTSDSRLFFALNGSEDETNPSAREVAARRDEWDEILGGGSTRRASSRLAIASETHVDRLEELLEAAESRAPADAQIVVVTIGGERDSIGRSARRGSGAAESDATFVFRGARFIDASSSHFDNYFQLGSEFNDVRS